MKQFAKSAAGALVLGLVPTLALAETQISYSSWFPGSSTLHTRVLTPMFERITEATGGEVTFNVFTDGTVAGGRTTLAAVRDGVADMGLLATSYHPAELRTAAWLSEASIMVRDALVGAGAYNEMIFQNCDACLAEMQEQGIVPIAYHATPPYQMLCNRPLVEAEDMQGLRVRTIGSWASWVTAAGGVPVNMTVPEAYEGLERGQLDCVAGNAAWLIQMSLYDVVSHVSTMTIGTFAGGIPINMNADSWDALTPEQQRIFQREGAFAAVDVALEFAAEDAEALAQSDSHGVTLDEPSDGLRAAFTAFSDSERARMLDMAAQRGVENAEPLLDRYLALLAEWQAYVDEVGGDRTAVAERIFARVTGDSQ